MRGARQAIITGILPVAALGQIPDGADSSPNPHSVAPARSVVANEIQPEVIEKSAGRVALGEGPIRVELVPAKGGAGGLGARIAALGPNRRLYLSVRELAVAEQPGVLYHLYFNLARDRKACTGRAGYIGALNFYTASVSGAELSGPRADAFQSFDITDAARALRSKKLSGERTVITICPSGRPAPGSEPTIGEILVVEQ